MQEIFSEKFVFVAGNPQRKRSTDWRCGPDSFYPFYLLIFLRILMVEEERGEG